MRTIGQSAEAVVMESEQRVGLKLSVLEAEVPLNQAERSPIQIRERQW